MKTILTALVLIAGLAQAAPLEVCSNQWSTPQSKPAAQPRFTPEQQAKDQQQQAKDTQQAAKDKQQCDTDARQIAFSHMLDRREFTYNQQKPDPNYKCPKPCCNGQAEQPKTGCYTAPIAGFGCGKKPQEPACPLRPANLDTESVKEYNEKINAWSKERAKYLEDLDTYRKEKTKHMNRSGGGDLTNPGGGGNESGFLNPHRIK